MSLAQYGFQKLVLLNSAGYSRAELPLDDSVSIIAPNNTGKTSLINALQFLLILDKRLMDFGAHSLENTRRFYFPDNSAYILLEVLLPSGMVVIGCVGKGLSHDYEYFAYQGSLNVENFRGTDGKLVTQPYLISRLLESGKSVKIYPQSELRALLYGNRNKQRSDDLNLTIFPLEFPSHAETYQRILTRTLRLDSLKSNEVKNYLLEIFKNDLQARNVDFKSEWDKSFADVNYDKSQYDAVFRYSETISTMAENHQKRLELRGKIMYFRPLIESGLNDWEAYLSDTTRQNQQRTEALNTDSSRLESRQKDIYKEIADVKTALSNQQNSEKNYQSLAIRFQFVTNLAQLQNQQTILQNQRDELMRVIKNAEQHQSSDAIKRQLSKLEKEKFALEQQLNSLHNNLYLQLQTQLSTEHFELLTKLLARSVLSFPVENTLQNSVIFENFAQNFSDLKFDISTFEPNLILKTALEIEAEIADCEQQRNEFEMLLKTVETLSHQKSELQKFNSQLSELHSDIVTYHDFLELHNQAASRQKFINDLKQKIAELDVEESTLTDKKKALEVVKSNLRTEQNELQSQNRRINQAKQQRIDHKSPFNFLDSLPSLPCVVLTEIKMTELANQIENYNQDCLRLCQLDDSLNHQLTELHLNGITKFQVADSAEKELETLFNYASHLTQEHESIERKARVAVVNVAVILRDLRNSLETLQRKMREFNQKINRRQLSDLATFKIEPREEAVLVGAIQTLISTSEQVESGDSFNLFNHNTVLDDKDLNKAKDLLIREGEARGSLRVEHLFQLVFVIAKENQPPSEFTDIDSAASNGTVLMAKLITGLAMLNQMKDPRKNIKTACYLDEAASLDQQNQYHLIKTAAEFGFSLIFASPEPQITARYCVPISTTNGKNHISQLHWQIIEPL
jgi:hypothetical protein